MGVSVGESSLSREDLRNFLKMVKVQLLLAYIIALQVDFQGMPENSTLDLDKGG